MAISMRFASRPGARWDGTTGLLVMTCLRTYLHSSRRSMVIEAQLKNIARLVLLRSLRSFNSWRNARAASIHVSLPGTSWPRESPILQSAVVQKLI
ncbi:hypothetical protein BDZ85DRAFT_6457 [Elsinoe ampelina]|uniref:Uncharacterized protein n=1 Tax=Elsinoe ampelina TaxID=302913 RepID=A0A6A6GQ18_9PEZI|nr:hypothetical protein BDZ85DRAFT_6457 [Elsinoe ampelina]